MNIIFLKMIKSPAKINLFLHVVGKNNKGYHLLDSLVVFLSDLCDEIKIEKNHNNEVIFTGPWKDKVNEENTVVKALKLMSAYIPEKLKISVKKNIPVGAGLGGGSSNAGCLIKYLLSKYKIKISKKELLQICNSIGADVAMFLYSKGLYFNGTGDIITQLRKIPALNILILYPNVLISTERVYKLGFKKYKAKLQHELTFASQNQLVEFLKLTDNDLYSNALTIFPELETLIAEIKQLKGCLLARMTGSGSVCFGIFDDIKNAKQALISLQKEFPNYSIYRDRIK